MSNYKDGVGGSDFCFMEGCIGNGHCPRCGTTNYQYLGYLGAVARWSKAWGLTKEETEYKMSLNHE